MKFEDILNQLGEEVTTPKEHTHRSYNDNKYPSTQYGLLVEEDNMTEDEATKVCDKYGYYAGTKYYRLKQQGKEVEFDRKLMCDEPYRSILIKYRKILAEEGIKAANKYFFEANQKL